MPKVLIKGLTGKNGSSQKMICYIDNKEICRIKENESFLANVENGTHSFKCGLTLGSPLSKIYEFEAIEGDIVSIEAKEEFWKPSVEFANDLQNTKNEIELINQKEKFNPNIKIDNYFYLDNNNKLWAIPEGVFKIKTNKVYKYNDILNFELVEDGNSITKGGLGTALAGGAIFGGVGAIVGGTVGKKKNISTCSSLKIIITIKNINDPVVYINLISYEVKKSSYEYENAKNTANKIISLLQNICNEIEQEEAAIKRNDPVEEIKKYKELLDSGIINQEEFDKKKKELLNL